MRSCLASRRREVGACFGGVTGASGETRDECGFLTEIKSRNKKAGLGCGSVLRFYEGANSNLEPPKELSKTREFEGQLNPGLLRQIGHKRFSFEIQDGAIRTILAFWKVLIPSVVFFLKILESELGQVDITRPILICKKEKKSRVKAMKKKSSYFAYRDPSRCA